MEKISCDVIEDLLPLYCDDFCSEDSQGIIDRHLRNCSKCSKLLEKMKTEYRLENGKCFIILKRRVISQANGSDQVWIAEWKVPKTGLTDSGNRVTVQEIYCGTKNNNFLI